MTDTNQTEELTLVDDEPKITAKSDEMLAVEKQLVSFNRTEAGLADLTEKYGGMIYDCTDSKQLKLAREARGEIKKPRVNVEKIRKAAKAPILDLGRSIDARAAVLKTALVALEDPIDKQIKAFEEIEVKRLAAISGRMEEIGMFVELANESQASSMQIAEHLNSLLNLTINDELFEEFETEALEKQNAAISQVRSRFENAEQREKDAAELAQLRRDKEEREREEAAEEQRKADLAAAAQKTVDDANAEKLEETLDRSVPEDVIVAGQNKNLGQRQIDVGANHVEPATNLEEQIEDELAASDADFDNCVVVDEATNFDDLPAAFDINEDGNKYGVIKESGEQIFVEGKITIGELPTMTYPGLKLVAEVLCKEFGIDVPTAETWIEKAANEVLPF